MISGTLNVEECKSLSHGRVSGFNAKNLLFNSGVMDGRTEEESLTRVRPEVSDCKLRDAAKSCKRKKIYRIYKNGVI
jgi:hypothetical protein